jgi:hypothetical protein
VERKVIAAIADTKAVDLWILFHIRGDQQNARERGHAAKAWADRLTRIFGD